MELLWTEINGNEVIDGYVAKAQKALNEFMALNQEQIDAIVKAMTLCRFLTSIWSLQRWLLRKQVEACMRTK